MKATTTHDTPARTATTCFRLLLQAELAKRCADNPQYSLRAFADSLRVDSSTLSQIVRGKRALTEPTIRRLGAALNLSADRIDAYVVAQLRHPSDDESRLQQVQRLASDTVALLSDWYHFAILELLRLDSFRPDSRWIARVLGITVDEVNVALARLTHLRLLEMADQNMWIDRSGHATASLDDFGWATVRHLSGQLHQLALDAVRRTPTSCRDRSSTTIAVRSERVPEAIECLARFRSELVALIEQDSDRDDVYQLELAFFPVTSLKVPQE